jgi:hypothetical protein
MYSGQKRDDLWDPSPNMQGDELWRRVRSGTQARQELVPSRDPAASSQKNMGRVGALISKVNRIMGQSSLRSHFSRFFPLRAQLSASELPKCPYGP